MFFINFIKKQFIQLSKDRKKTFYKKLKIFFLILSNFFYKALIVILFSLPVILLRFIKPFFYVRFGTISSEHIGHFISDAGILLCESFLRKNIVDFMKMEKVKDLYWLETPSCNKQVELMIKRNFYVRSWVKFLYITNNIIPGGSNHSIPQPREKQGSRDIEGFFYKTKELQEAYLNFNEKENSEGHKFLQSVGMNEKDKYVCLNVRDPAYKKRFYPSRDWSYHDYRNSEIDTYLPAAEALAEKGYWVFRMGKVVKEPFNSKHPKVIDYALSSKRSDFLDVWLMAHCAFCITTACGLDSVAEIYRRPFVTINHVPPGDAVSYHDNLLSFKKLFWRETKKRLTLQECLDNHFLDTKKYVEKGIEIVNLKPNEIKDIVLEMEMRVKNEWEDTLVDIESQKKFIKVFKKSEAFNELHRFLHPKFKISTMFLKQNPDFKT